jgi:hypothetical protein
MDITVPSLSYKYICHLEQRKENALTIQGQLFSTAAIPPTILLSGMYGLTAGEPHAGKGELT